MFTSYWSLKELNISNFNTNKVIDMSKMFSALSKMEELDLYNFTTDNINNMSYMFLDYVSLKN